MLRLVVCIAVLATSWAGADDVPPQAISAHRPRPMDQPIGNWEMYFEEVSFAEYARQIDFFKIEIAAAAPDGKAEYISNVSKSKPDKHAGEVADDFRWHWSWKTGTLLAADRDLLAKAGISVRGKDMMHFVPVELQARMAAMERDYQHLPPSEIRNTRFQIQPAKKDGYEIVVVKQDRRRESEPAEEESPSSRKKPR
jgi:hypothetical protein